MMDQLPSATPTARQRATAAQREAADPAVSAFVSASAGSGKTKLLTDRLLRLLLAGADPRRILCLTYTTAAAAEMALRLRRELAKWATGADAGVDAALRELGLSPRAALRLQARALFAQVLDLPGGMRIETIHAFCQSLLRRFPLEADVSPHFRVLADADATAAMQAAQEDVLEAADPASAERAAMQQDRREALAQVAGAVPLSTFFHLARGLAEDRVRLRGLQARAAADLVQAQRAVLGVTRDAAAILDEAIAWPEQAELTAALRVIACDERVKRPREGAQARLDWLSCDMDGRRAGWDAYAASYLTKEGEPLAFGSLVGGKLAKEQPDIGSTIGDEVARVLRLLDEQRAERAAVLSAALLTLALPVAQTYARRKRGAARLDYADLIDGTTGLFAASGAAWVLHKLDGGLDHLLLDEVQDTSPDQWAIAGALVDEFFAGQGAQDRLRTVFAVGDRKQSIFSFQGAEPAAFDAWRTRLRDRAEGAGRLWRDVALDVSFRSTTPVLALTDAVFADPAAARGVVDGVGDGALRHRSDREGQAGRVELWPLEQPPEKIPLPVWDAPVRRERAKGAPQRLAERIADWVALAVATPEMLPSRGRAVAAGDILILVRRRDDLAQSIVRALKHRGVPVAGLDRMTLTEQPAVADLLALCDALLLPQDDLAVACVLTSPLGGLDDDDLIALAPGRSGWLWDELRRRAPERPTWTAAWDFFAKLFARVDFATPHALLSEALGGLGGRARLLARLGAEAAEPIDELLAAALAYSQEHPPALQGFVHWLRRSAAQVKRQPEAAGDRVRLMTVHGAKGLQAPIVILPDTTAVPSSHEELLWADGGVPIWAPAKEWRSQAVEALREAAHAKAEREHNRLLYVALTRAEDRLIVCGYETRNKLPDECWYLLVRGGLERLPTTRIETEAGTVLRHAVEQSAAPDRVDRRGEAGPMAALPAWAGAAPAWRAAPLPEAAPGLLRLAPSRPAGVEHGAIPPSMSPLSRQDPAQRGRFERGRLLHGLLQHLPDLSPPARPGAARRYLVQHGGLDVSEQEAALAELMAVLTHDALAPAFGPGSRAEVPLTGVVAGQVVGGLVDRLVVLPDSVLIVDYKTNRRPPDTPEQTPLAYLRQMAAYRAVLQAVYPDRAVACVLVWTVGAFVMTLPRGLLDGFAPGAREAVEAGA